MLHQKEVWAQTNVLTHKGYEEMVFWKGKKYGEEIGNDKYNVAEDIYCDYIWGG